MRTELQNKILAIVNKNIDSDENEIHSVYTGKIALECSELLIQSQIDLLEIIIFIFEMQDDFDKGNGVSILKNKKQELEIELKK